MARDIEYTVRLNHTKAQAAARALHKDFSRMNTTYRTTISMQLVDNVTKKLRGIFNMLGGEGGFTKLFNFDSPGITNKIKKLGNSISSIFKSDENKKWYEKTVGYFKTAEKWARNLGEALVGAFTLGGAAITAGIGVVSAILSKQLIKINSEMEQYEVSLRTTLGSLTAAKKEMSEIVLFAKETPYEIKEVTNAVVKLRAYSMDSDKWLEPLGNAASAFGRDITDAVQGMFRRALSYGLKMDRADFKQGGKYAGMTYAGALMMELEKRFKGGMELQARTLKGIWSNIKDSLYISFQEATKPLYGVIKQQVKSLYDFLGSPEGQKKLKQLIGVMSDMLSRIISSAKKAFEFAKANILPIIQTLGKSMLEVSSSVSEIVTPLLTALVPLIGFFTSILNLLTWIVTQSKLLLKIFIGYVAAVRIFKLLEFSIQKTGINLKIANKEATLLGGAVKKVGASLGFFAVSFAAMWAIGNYIETKNNLKEIGNEIYNVAKGAERVKDYLKEVGLETGHSLKEMSKLALVAKKFGHNMSNVIEAASQATGEALKGQAKNLSVDVDVAADAIGRLAEAFIEEGNSFEQMKAKTQAAKDMLIRLDRVSEDTGILFNDLSIAIDGNRDTLAKYADNIEELTFLIEQFGKAAKEAGIEANVGQFLDALGMLLAPTKEMLLTLPSSTWVAKSLEDIDLNTLSDMLSDALDMKDVQRALTRTETVALKVITASEVTRKNLEEGADYTYDKLVEAAAVITSMQNGGGPSIGPGASQVKSAGWWTKVQNFSSTGPGVATEIAGALTLYVVYMKLLNNRVKNLSEGILKRGVESLVKIEEAMKAQVAAKLKEEAAKKAPGAAKAAKATAAAEKVSTPRRILGTLLLNAIDRRAHDMSVAVFKKGFSLKNLGETFRGWGREISNIEATKSLKSARGRVFSTTIGPYVGRAMGKARGIVTGRGLGETYELPQIIQRLSKNMTEYEQTVTKLAYAERMRLREVYNPQTNPFAKYSKFMPSTIQQQLVEMGVKPTPEFEKMMEKVVKKGVTWTWAKADKGGFFPKANEIRVPQVGKRALGSQAGINTFFHELSHALQEATPKLQSIMSKYNLLLEETLAIEKNAWNRTIRMYKNLGINLDKLSVRAQAATSLGSYISTIKKVSRINAIDMAGEYFDSLEGRGGRDARGRFVRGNKYQFTSETAPRMTTARAIEQKAMAQITENMRRATEAFGKQLSLLPEKIATSVRGQLSMFSTSAFKAGIPGEQLALFDKFFPGEQLTLFQKEIVAIEKTTATTSNQLDLFSKNLEKSHKQLSLFEKETAITKTATKAVTKTLSNMASAAIWASLPEAIDELVKITTGKSIEQVPHAGPYLKGAISTVGGAVNTFLSPFTEFGNAIGTQISDAFNKGVDAYQFTSDTGVVGWLKDLSGYANKLGKDIVMGIGRGIKDSVKTMNEGLSKLFTGKEIGADRFGLSEKVWGKDIAKLEASIESLGDVREREAQYAILHEAKVAAYTEKLKDKQTAVFNFLAERIQNQYDVLAEAGKAVPEVIMNELARAGTWVKNNVHFGTEITDQMIADFESGGSLAAHALAVAIENALSAYDFETPEGFKTFLEDVGDGQVAFQLGIEALRKLDTEYKNNEERLSELDEETQKFEKSMRELEDTIAGLDNKLMRLGNVISSLTSVFDLSLAINEAKLFSDAVLNMESDLTRLNLKLSSAEYEMMPLQKALNKTQKEFESIQSEIDKTRSKLDSFMNAPIEGEEAYREKKYQLERQLADIEYAIEKSSSKLNFFDALGISGSDAYDRAAVPLKALENKRKMLQQEMSQLDYEREKVTAPVQHAVEMRQLKEQGPEVAGEEIIKQIELLGTQYEELQKISNEKQIQLEKDQAAVDKQTEKIEAISYEISLREAQLKIIQNQVLVDNSAVDAAKKKAEHEQEIERLKASILGFDEKILGVQQKYTKEKLTQAAIDAAAGKLSQQELQKLLDLWNSASMEEAKTGAEKTIKETEKANLQYAYDIGPGKEVETLNARQTELSEKMNNLVEVLNKMIDKVDIKALSRTDLESVFGADIGSVINGMAQNIAALAAGKAGSIAYGIANPWQELVRVLQETIDNKIGNNALGAIINHPTISALAEKGPEAVIPLQNGSVPVKLFGTANGGTNQHNYNVTVDFSNLVVRDDKDLEEIKRYMLDLRSSLLSMSDNATQY